MHWDAVNLPPLGLLWRYGGWWRWAILALTLGGAGTVPAFPLPGAGALGCAAVFLWFFRDPSRPTPDSAMLVSPVDGVVDDVGTTDACPLLQVKAFRIGILLSVLDAHATRAPVTGTVQGKVAVRGAYRNAMRSTAGGTNRRNEVWLTDASGRSVIMRQIAGAVARQAIFAPAIGDTIRAGAVVGMIRFGSRVELFLPRHDGYTLTVSSGDRVVSGVSLLATIDPFRATRLSTPEGTALMAGKRTLSRQEERG